ncbi:MAG: VTT domain-containing protein [Phycisphaerales bacterium]|nr:VTT domain-containing protein [Phycisphaerales bacterium]
MKPAVENESQLQPGLQSRGAANASVIESKPIQNELNKSDIAQIDSNSTRHQELTVLNNECASHGSVLSQAACVMVGARLHASEKANGRRLGNQALHWGVLFVGALISLPIVMPTLSQGSQDWMNSHLLQSPGNWKLLVLMLSSSSLLAYGFVNRLGTERVHGGCAMLRRLGPAAILGVAWSTIPSFAGVMLVLNMEPIRLALIGDGSSTVHMATGMSVYLVGFVLLAGFGCLPTVSQAILAGYAFGVPMGLGLALFGFGGASLIGYELVGRIARGRVEEELQRKPKAAMLRDALVRANPIQAFILVTLLRASPSAPFALTNLLLGSLGVSRKVFFFGTIIGMLPRTLAAVLIGQQFTGWNGGIDKPRWMIIAGIVAVIVLVVLVSKIAAKALKRVADHTVQGHESPVISA